MFDTPYKLNINFLMMYNALFAVGRILAISEDFHVYTNLPHSHFIMDMFLDCKIQLYIVTMLHLTYISFKCTVEHRYRKIIYNCRLT